MGKAGKAEKRVDTADGVAYSKAQLVEYYGEAKADKIWEAAGKRAAGADEPRAKAKAKAKVKKARDEVPDKPFHLSYFGVMAKGLAPALCAELSGRPWTATTFKDPATEWQGEKGLKATGKCPFGQVPLLEVQARGKAPALNIGQATAICNYIGRVAKRTSGLAGENSSEYAMSQMLMAEGEDLFSGLGKNQTTVFAKEYGVNGKASAVDAKKWWAETVPDHIAMLEKLLASTEGPAFTKSGTTVGEVYLFAMLHQMVLVKSALLDGAAGLKAWYSTTKANASIAKVLSSESAGGEYKQYFGNF